MSGRLNADASVTAVACANQVARRFGDAGVVLEDILRPDSGDSVPGMLSRHGRTTPFTGEFCNVRHMCTAACGNARVSVAAVCRSAGNRFDGDGRGGGIGHINIGSRPVQRRAARSSRRTRRLGCQHLRHRAPHGHRPECRGRRRSRAANSGCRLHSLRRLLWPLPPMTRSGLL